MTGPTRPPTDRPNRRAGRPRPVRTDRPRLLGAPAVPRCPLDPGALHRAGLLRALVPARRAESPAIGPDVAARDAAHGVDGRRRPGGRPQPDARPSTTWWAGRTRPSGARRAAARHWPYASVEPQAEATAAAVDGSHHDAQHHCPRSTTTRRRRRPSRCSSSATRSVSTSASPSSTPWPDSATSPPTSTGASTPDSPGRTTSTGRPNSRSTSPTSSRNLVVVMIGANDPQGLVTPTAACTSGSPVGTRPTRPGWPPSSPRPTRPGPTCCGSGCRRCRTPGLDAALKHLNSLVAAQVAQTKDGGAAYLSSVPSLGDKKGNFARVPARRIRGRGQCAHPRRHPPDPGGRGPPGRRGGGRHPDGQLHIQLNPGVGGTGREATSVIHRRAGRPTPVRWHRPVRRAARDREDGRRSARERPRSGQPGRPVERTASASSATAAPSRSSGSPSATNRSRSSTIRPGTSSSAKSQMTVRSLGWAWKHRPWSMPQSCSSDVHQRRGRSCGRRCWPPRRRRRTTWSSSSRPPSSSRVK